MCSAAQANYLPEALREEARALGARMAQERIDLVFGGGSVGLMGVLADAVLAGGGKVTGVISSFLATKELAHAGITRQVVTRTIHSGSRRCASWSTPSQSSRGASAPSTVLLDPHVEAVGAARPADRGGEHGGVVRSAAGVLPPRRVVGGGDEVQRGAVHGGGHRGGGRGRAAPPARRGAGAKAPLPDVVGRLLYANFGNPSFLRHGRVKPF